MNAKWHIINHLACAVVFLSVCSFSAFSQERDTIFIIEHDTLWMDLQPDAVIESQTRENRYDRRVHRYRRHWEALIPTHTKIQFAGNMGLLSFGTGWDYGRRNQWETDVFFGVLPKYDSKRTKLTFTVKQNYLPWSLQIKQSRFSVEPLACGMYLNTVFGDEFWVNEPERYPKGYYGFSSKVRIHAFLGQRITYDIDPQRRFTAKEITFFYTVILFLVLKKVLFKPVLNIIEQRENMIQDDLAAGAKAKNEGIALRKEYEEKVSLAKEEGKEIIKQATARAEQKSNQIIA